MINVNYFLITIGIILLSTATYAANGNTLKIEREETIRQYVADLQAADYKAITQLFEKNGIVVSTSQGKVDAKTFFYSFLPNINFALTRLHQTFTSNLDDDRMAARFHFIFKLKDGEKGEGEYIDEFVFAKNTNKLNAVYMFENLKFNDKWIS